MANNIEKQLKEISERLEQGVKEIFTSERYTEYLNTMSKFHNYSFNNTLLITILPNWTDRIKFILIPRNWQWQHGIPVLIYQKS